MNLSYSVIGQSLSPIRSIFRSVADVPKRFANNCDDGVLIERECSGRMSVQRKSRPRPTEYGLANFAPFLFRWYLDNHNARFVSSRILKGQMKIAVRFDFHSHDTTSESVLALIYRD